MPISCENAHDQYSDLGLSEEQNVTNLLHQKFGSVRHRQIDDVLAALAAWAPSVVSEQTALFADVGNKGV
jgi:hypothetical protein